MPNDISDSQFERFVWDEAHPIFVKSECHLCKHKFIGKPGCTAFPVRLPGPLASGKVLHHDPYPGDRGIRFEPRKQKK